jgi:hypothetical protein
MREFYRTSTMMACDVQILRGFVTDYLVIESDRVLADGDSEFAPVGLLGSSCRASPRRICAFVVGNLSFHGFLAGCLTRWRPRGDLAEKVGTSTNCSSSLKKPTIGGTNHRTSPGRLSRIMNPRGGRFWTENRHANWPTGRSRAALLTWGVLLLGPHPSGAVWEISG